MERWIGRVALVTGASVGIGAAITRALVKHGLKVIGCARNVKQIEDLKEELKSEKGLLFPAKCDLSKEEEILSMFGMIETVFGGVDICINNAGIAHDAPLLSGSTSDWRNMLDVNVLALCVCTREAVKQMKKKEVDDGHIILLNSTSGHRIKPSGSANFYSASKFAVSGILEGLGNELRDMNSNIRVTSVSPDRVDTEFIQRMFKSEEKGRAFCNMFKCLEANDVADAVIYAIGTPPYVQIHDILIRPTEQSS